MNPPEPSDDAPRRWLRLGHLDLSDLLVETFSVLLGVLLALLINAWVQKRQTQDKVGEAMTSIRQELKANQQTLAGRSSYYHDMVRQIEAVPSTQQPQPTCDELPAWHGIYSPFESQLLRAAYDTATGSGVFADMDFESTRRIASLYAELARYETYYAKVIDWMMEQRLATHADGFELQMCRGILRDLGSAAGHVEQDLGTYLDEKQPSLPKSQAQ